MNSPSNGDNTSPVGESIAERGRLEDQIARERQARLAAEKIATARLERLTGELSSLRSEQRDLNEVFRQGVPGELSHAIWLFGQGLLAPESSNDGLPGDITAEDLHGQIDGLIRTAELRGWALFAVDGQAVDLVHHWMSEDIDLDFGTRFPPLGNMPLLREALKRHPGEVFEIDFSKVDVVAGRKTPPALLSNSVFFNIVGDVGVRTHFLVIFAESHLQRFIAEVVAQAASAAIRMRIRGQASVEAARARAKRALIQLQTLVSTGAMLAAATTDDIWIAAGDSAQLMSALLEVPGLAWYELDHSQQEYVLRFSWVDEPYSGQRSLSERIAFGTRPFMDRCRLNGGVNYEIPPKPTLLAPSRLGLTVDFRGQPQHLLIAARLSTDAWPEQYNETLQQYAMQVRNAIIRTQHEDSLNKYFLDCPVPMVLRNTTSLELVDYNEAFADFIGADREELKGTTPDFVLYEDVSQLSAEMSERDGWIFEVKDDFTPAEGDSKILRTFKKTDGSVRLALTQCTDLTASSSLLVNWIVDITEEARKLTEIRHLVSHDELTGCLNETGLYERLKAELSTPYTLVLADCDRFSEYNESYGFTVGNEVLLHMARKIRRSFDEECLICRSGADHFMIIVPGVHSTESVTHSVRMAMTAIAEPLCVGPDNTEIRPSVSFGIARGRTISDVNETRTSAARALAECKARGGRSFRWGDGAEASSSTSASLALEAEMSRALEHELRVFYQPIGSFVSGGTKGAEALVRWQHPERGLLPAGAFMELAERVGMAADISEFVMRTAFADAASWPDEHLQVAVNLTSTQLDSTYNLHERFTDALTSSGLSPSRAKLEVTESSLIGDLDEAQAVLKELRDAGAEVYLDDFGTGYSALSYLRHLPIDGIKIDRSFVAGIATDESSIPSELAHVRKWNLDNAFVEIIVSVASSLGLVCVAEGVETSAQENFLRDLGVDLFQGYLLSKPIPDRHFRRFLEQHRDLG